MPEKETLERARRDKREGKAPTTQAGEFVREEIHHVREGKHGARSPKQAIAIGLSKARRAGVDLPPPRKGKKGEPRRAASRKALARQARTAARRRKTPARRAA
ncbi:MAG: transcription elongation factor [Candidatus Rokuibacteriota bacterium]|nr:MAG: transcription elongation factor [Candidatus Rokubacteria bacterium]